MAHVPNFWDPNESSSDDEYNTPSSPSSVALEPPQLLSAPRSGSHHTQRQSVSAIRLPVQMSDDEEEEEEEQQTLEEEEGQEEQQVSEEYKQLPDAAAEDDEAQSAEQGDDEDDAEETQGDSADSVPAAVAEQRASTREMLFRLSDKRVERTAEEQKEQQTAEPTSSAGVGDSPVQTQLSTPPPIPARRSSQPLPALSLPPSRFTNTMPMPSFPPPPSASPLSSSPLSTTPPDTGRPSSSPSLAAQTQLPASSVPPRPSSASTSAASSSPARSFSSHLRTASSPCRVKQRPGRTLPSAPPPC